MQERLIELYPLIQELCRNISRSEDLAHDTLLRLNKLEYLDEVPEDMIRHFIYQVAKNLYLNQIKRDKYCALLFDVPQVEEEQLIDPYDYIKAIRESKLDEIERLWLDTYLDWGNYLRISENVNISRQTISKKIKEVCLKLRN